MRSAGGHDGSARQYPGVGGSSKGGMGRPVVWRAGPDVGGHRRHVHHTVLITSEMMAKPPGEKIEMVEARPRATGGGPIVAPGPDHGPGGAGEMLRHGQHPVDIAVDPATDEKGGALDGAVVGTWRAVEPVVVTLLMTKPYPGPLRRVLQPVHPLLVPTVPDDVRVGGQRVANHHRRWPIHLFLRMEGASRVVDIAGEAVMGGVDRGDGLELGRTEHGGL